MPLRRKLPLKRIVYRAQVTSASKTETYVGLTATEFKARFRNHQVSFNNETRKNDTELSKHIWQLKSKEQRFTIKWKILAKAKPYSNLTKRCNLCTAEKHFIITKPELATLNKRNELISTCRHAENLFSDIANQLYFVFLARACQHSKVFDTF